MLEDGASVSQACVGSGFVSVSHFSRAFKREYRGNPSRHAASDRSKGMERNGAVVSSYTQTEVPSTFARKSKRRRQPSDIK
jgi:AraC-like DNA-binding protein